MICLQVIKRCLIKRENNKLKKYNVSLKLRAPLVNDDILND